MPFEDAVKKITVTPAKKFGIRAGERSRKEIFADLVCLRGDEVKFTVVNGRVVEKENDSRRCSRGKHCVIRRQSGAVKK